MSLAVAVVSYNTRDLLRACLASARQEQPAEIVVVDNGSADGSTELVRNEFPEVRLIIDAANRGYGAAANRAIAACTSRYVLLLNADTRVGPGALAALGRYLDTHPRVALVGPRLLNLDGTLQPSCFPFLGTFRLSLEKSRVGEWLASVPWLNDHYLVMRSPHTRARAVPWVLGAALTIRREAFDAIGGFDESFFLYAEEVDLSYRLKGAGWETHFMPDARVVHVGGASAPERAVELAGQRRASAIQFYRKHYWAPRAMLLETLVRAAQIVRRDGGRP